MPAKTRAQRRENRKRAEHEKALHEQTKKEQHEKAQAEREKQYAHVNEYFITTYGHDSTKLDIWQELCVHIGIPPESSITKCKKALKSVFINIFDFVQARDDKVIPHRFPDKSALRTYSKKNHKIFPLAKAKKSPILKVLLIEMYSN